MANTYYVANAGSDSNSGLSAILPFQSLTHAFTIASTNDTVLANGGDSFLETATISQNGQTLSSYGTGLPTIDAANIATGWSADVSGPVVVQDLENPAPNDTNGFSNSTRKSIAGSFTASSTFTLVQVGIMLATAGGTPESSAVSCHIYADTGGSGPGTLLATATNTRQDTLTGTGTNYLWQYTGVSITSGTKYWVGLTVATADGSEWIEYFLQNGVSGQGTYYSSNGTSWTSADTNEQFAMQLYATGAGVANVWDITPSTPTVNQVFKNGVRAIMGTSKAALTNQQWFFDGATLSYCDTVGNPDLQGYTLTMSQRVNCIYAISLSGLTIENIITQNANNSGIILRACNTTTVNAITAKNHFWYGVEGGYVTTTGCTSINVTNCIMSLAGGNGITLGDYSGNWYVGHNLVAGCCCLYVSGFEDEQQFTGGIRSFAPNGSGGHIIEYNHCTQNGITPPVSGDQGTGIDMDTVSGTIPATIRYNICDFNYYQGIFLERTSNCIVYFNICHGNTNGDDCAGIRIAGNPAAAAAASSNLIYNNVCYGNDYGIDLDNEGGAGTGNLIGNIIKNNICSGNLTYQLTATGGGQNDGTYGSGNIYTYNCFGAQATNFIQWGSSTYSTYALWNSASGAGAGITDHYVNADPQFTNAATGNFSLQATSPCIDAGVYIAGINNNFSGRAPDMGAFEFNQNSPNVISPATNPNCVITPTGQNLFTAFLAV